MLPQFRATIARLPLAARLMITSGGLLSFFGIVFLVTMVQGEIDAQRILLAERLQDEMQFAIPALTGSAIVGDYAVIEQMLQARAMQPQVARFAWTDSTGHKIAAEGPLVPNLAQTWFTRRVAFVAPEASQKIEVGGVSYGTIDLRLSTTDALNRVWRLFIERLMLGLAGAAVVLLATCRILVRGMRPLRELADSATRFGTGNYAARSAAHGSPETVRCALAFNSMADSIESLVRSLRDAEAKNLLLASVVEQASRNSCRIRS